MHQNVSLGSNGVDRVRSLRKIATRLRDMNNCASLACFAPSFVRQQKGPECTQIVSNAPKRELRVNGVDQVRSLQKIPSRLRGTNFCTSSSRFVLSFVRKPMGSECTQIVRNAPKRQFRFQWVGSGAFVAKTSTRLCGTDFCISSACFAPSFVRQPNGPECTQIV